MSGNTNTYTCLPKQEGEAGWEQNHSASYPTGIMKRKSLDMQGQAVSHVGPLQTVHKTPGHPTPEPWEIPLASIVLGLS